MKHKNNKKFTKQKSYFKRNIAVLLVTFFLALPVFTALWCFYGPFEEIRSTWICTAMSTARHKYLATTFFDYKTIDRCLAEKSTIKGGIPNIDYDAVNIESGTNNTITVENVSIGFSNGKLMKITNPSKIDVSVCNYIGNSGMRLPDLISQENAVAGINAGAYIDREGEAYGSSPGGVILKDTELITFEKEGNEDICLIGFNNQNKLIIEYIKSRREIEKLDIRCAVSFGPPLIINSKPLIETSGTSLQPRTAIAQCRDGSVLFLVLDGRQPSSAGATLKNVQDLLLKHGAVNAANLDGGSSSAMIKEGQLLTSPSDNRGLKKIPSAFVVKE